MKMLFLLFVLINAVYFYFQSAAEDKASTPVLLSQPKLPAGAESLVLLRERGLGGGESAAKGLLVTNKNVLAQSVIKKAPPKPVAKAPAFTAERVEKKRPSKPQVELKKSAAAVCFTLGPFAKPSLAEQAVSAAKGLGIQIVQRKQSKRTPKGYWVYLTPSKTYQAAKRKVAELQKRGLKDLFIMGKGSRKNAISLGLFKNKEVAQERLKQVKKLGLKAEFETQYRVSEQSWLDMSVAGDQTATVAALTEMADRFAGTNLTQRKCQ